MDSRYIALAIPFFFALIGLEVAIGRWQGVRRYRFHDSIASLACGIGQQMIDVATKVFTLGAYIWVFRHLRVMTPSPYAIATWVAITVLVDLCYYGFHRASHRVNALWAMHAVHHQSEDYNLSTALRQSGFDPLIEWVFYLPLAVLGFDPLMFAASRSINLVYQFWIHTRAVKQLGPFEWVFNTPSHHRVHHGIDPAYIDKNYAGIFIVWDRLFGTFELERREPVYGTVKPLSSWNAPWANLEGWVRIARLAAAATTPRERVWAWFAPPEWRPASLGGPVIVPEVDKDLYRRFETRVRRGVDVYVAVQFVIVSAVTTAALYGADSWGHATLITIGVLVVLTLGSWGALMQARPRAVEWEWARLGVVVLVVPILLRRHGQDEVMGGAVALVIALASAVAIGRYRGTLARRTVV